MMSAASKLPETCPFEISYLTPHVSHYDKCHQTLTRPNVSAMISKGRLTDITNAGGTKKRKQEKDEAYGDSAVEHARTRKCQRTMPKHMVL